MPRVLSLENLLVLNRTFDVIVTIGLSLPSPQLPTSPHNSARFLRLAAVGLLRGFSIRGPVLRCMFAGSCYSGLRRSHILNLNGSDGFADKDR
jgi:hypothetical protein